VASDLGRPCTLSISSIKLTPQAGMAGHIGASRDVSVRQRQHFTSCDRPFSVATAMAIPTFLVGLLPTYQTIGVLAPIGLTLLRVVQGLSVGGEYPSSMVFLVEHAPEGRRGLMGAVAATGGAIGMLLGSAVGAADAEREKFFGEVEARIAELTRAAGRGASGQGYLSSPKECGRPRPSGAP
jgi:Sugar (and other) transporter